MPPVADDAKQTSGAAAAVWKAGDVVADKYVLERALARGGMGHVWVAQNRMTERRVAIKFMLPELATSPDTIQRFFREAKASARIDHPCIVDVLDLGTLPDGAPFMVMEYLEGRSLEQVIEQQPLAPIQAAALVLDVAHALAAAHAAGIVHRDLKPANVFVARKGEALVPKILDFGISKITSSLGTDVRMTRTGAVLGSPAYMSPEQARGRTDIDGRADVWAIGVILYEAVSGKLPFTGENYNQVMMAITLDPPTPLAKVAPAVDPDFVAIVDACLQKEREQRPETMDAVAALLDGYVAPRAAYGIPALDIGGERKPASSSQRIGAYAVPRAITTKPPASSPPPRRDDPAQLTVGGAVTVVDPAPRRRAVPRNVVVLGAVATLLLAGAGAGAYLVASKPRPSAATSAAHAEEAAPAPVATSAPSAVVDDPAPASSSAAVVPVDPVVSDPVVPAASTAKLVAPPATAKPVVAPAKPASSGAPVASASAAPAASAPASAPSTKPGAAGGKAKPKASAESEGPENVGPGPGF